MKGDWKPWPCGKVMQEDMNCCADDCPHELIRKTNLRDPNNMIERCWRYWKSRATDCPAP